MTYNKVQLRLAPEFVEPSTIKNMTEDEQLAFLEEIRGRRMVAVTLALEVQTKRKAAKNEKIQHKLARVEKRLDKQIEKLDDSLTMIENLLNEARILMIQMEDEE